MSSCRLARTAGAFLLAAGLGLAGQAAHAYSAVYVFGDSLSDNGNLFAMTGGGFPPASAYYQGRFSNGPVAVEVLASSLGAPLIDAAVGGATTGLFNGNFAPQHPLGSTGVLTQVSQFAQGLGGASADSSALYVVWAGANDFLHPTNVPTQLAAAIGVLNLAQTVNNLYGMGARNFLLPLMPDLGLTPRSLALGPVASGQGTGLTLSFNAALSSAYQVLANSLGGSTLTVFDTFAAQHQLAASGSLSNTTDACLATLACAGNPAVAATYMFWDDVHPTATTHTALGQMMYAQLQAVPEPSTVLTMAIGVLVLLGHSVRRRKGAAVESRG